MKKKTNKQIELARQVGLGSLEVPYPSGKHFPRLVANLLVGGKTHVPQGAMRQKNFNTGN